MVTESWKRAGELRDKAMQTRKQSDLDLALAAQCDAEREDAAKECDKCGPARPPCGWKSICQESPDTSRQLAERLGKVGQALDDVEREVIAVEGARSELRASPAAAYYPKYIEGLPAPGALPATESPRPTTRRRTNMVRKANQEGAAGAAEGNETTGRKPRATGKELADQRYASLVKNIVKMGETPTKGLFSDDKFKAAFVQIRKLVDDAEAKMTAERAAKAEIKDDQLKLAF